MSLNDEIRRAYNDYKNDSPFRERRKIMPGEKLAELPTISLHLTQFLSDELSIDEFRLISQMDSSRYNVFSFSGYAGQMFFNQLMNTQPPKKTYPKRSSTTILS